MPSGSHDSTSASAPGPARMGPRARARAVARARLRRARAVAVIAVVTCLAADAWAVSVAVSRDQQSSSARTSPVASMGSLSDQAGVSFTPATDVAETVEAEELAAAAGAAAAGATPAPSGSGASAASKAPSGATTGATVVERGDGEFTPVAVPADALKTAPGGRTIRVALEVEGGLGIDTGEFARTVATVLTDPRGWQSLDGVRFVAVSPDDVAKGATVDLRISLASPGTTDKLCAPLQTRGQVSCHNLHRVVLNARRWQLGAQAYGADVATYRTYLVNHEVGHGLGHGHASCPGAGSPAPVMMQQTYGLRGCTAWPWPTPKTS